MSTDLVEADKRELAGPDAVNELHLLVLRQWNGLDDFIAPARDKARARRLAIGRTLLGLQQLIDSGENGDQCTFWEWFDEMLPGRSRSDARDMMNTARQPDPEVTHQKKLDKQKEYNDRYYRKKLAGPPYKAEEAEWSPEITDQASAEPELLTPAPKPQRRFPSVEGDDALLDDFENIFRQLSWNGRVEGIRRINKLYNDWRAGKP
jgi:hypothetical protein